MGKHCSLVDAYVTVVT